MVRQTMSDKAERVLKFILALRNRRINSLLRAHGFGEADYKEGLQLLQAAIGPLLDFSVPEPDVEPKVIDLLDEWENKWFPIAQASLARRFPDVHKVVFNNLSQSQGPAVVVSVGTFVRRLDALGVHPDGSPDEGGLAARQLLERRGLTAKELAPVRALLKRAGSLEDAPEPQPPSAPDTAAAEDALWAWYLEWSTIARNVISDGRLLNQLGFKKGGRPAGSSNRSPLAASAADADPLDDLADEAATENEDEDEDEDEDEGEPVA